MNSPYEKAYGLTYANGDTSLERIPYEYIPSDKDLYHTVLDGETLQNIANRYYQDSGLWYILADVNGIYNPITDLKPGSQILVPNGRQ